MSLKWRGKEVSDHVSIATAVAGNSILGDCVIEAKSTVPVKMSILQGSIQMRAMQMVSRTGMSGLFGSWAVNYAKAVEEGTPPHIIRPVNAKALFWPGAEHPVMLVHHPGTKGRPYLRPAANKYFPQFASRIRQELQRG